MRYPPSLLVRRFSDAGNHEPFHALMRPASEKRQGTKSRWVGHRHCRQLTRGVPANVVILSREGLTGLIAANRIVAGTDVDLARVNLSVRPKTF